MTVSERQTWFPHPERPSSKVHVVFDICNMIKLMQNPLGDYKTMKEVTCFKMEGVNLSFGGLPLAFSQ